MSAYKEQFIIDDKGKRVGVLIDMVEYQKILSELEELESIRAYDAAKFWNDEVIPFEQAVKEIESKRR